MTPVVIGALLLLGTIVALDLVSVGQVMTGRPLVAGTMAGVIVGDPASGAMVGGLLELYALETLAVGGVRYPDFGPAAVVAAVALRGAPVELALGIAGVLGLAVAWIGEWGIVWLRRGTTSAVRARAAELDAGDLAVVRRLHFGAIGRDALRGLLLTGLGLVGAWALRAGPVIGARTAEGATLVVVGVGVATALTATLRLAGGTRRLAWLGASLAVGVVWVLR